MTEGNFDFQQLMKTFIEICPDFTAEPDFKSATVSRRFAEQVIFEYSKQAKLAKHQGIDQTWRVKLNAQGKKGKLGAEVIITAYVSKSPPLYQPFMLHGYLQLTFKQASLLAVAKYCQMVPHLIERNQIVLTPLAGAVFANEDMPSLASALDEPLPKVVMAVISSCQTDGFYLEHSRCYIALRALQKTVVDREKRVSLLKKNLKFYQQHGKRFDLKKYIICSRFVRANTRRPSTSPPDDLNYLVCEVMDLDKLIGSEPNPSPPATIKPKTILKCGASFDGLANENTK
ncbi:hypothetical protein ACLKA7_015009 [Drosophila subpalustris]